MAKEQVTLRGQSEDCDMECTKLLAEGWTLHSFVYCGEFYPATNPNGPVPYFAYVLIR
jgi:hypothetical protein